MKPDTAEHEERAEDHRVLGLRLDADPVRPLHVATHDRPHDADEERDAGGVADGGVGAVHVAVEELRVLGQLVVDLEHRRDGEQDDEREVDEAVHEPGGGIAQQGLHVDAGPEVAEPPLGVPRRRALDGRERPAPSCGTGRRTASRSRRR